MEKFVDRIIETDRKAREIIEDAQNRRDQLQKDAQKEAAELLAQRAAASEAAIAKLDADFAAREKRASDRTDAEYLAAKHALDRDFDAGYDKWLQDALAGCTAAAPQD